MLLYDSPVSGNCYKVRLLLAHLDVGYERQTVDVVDRSDRPQLLGELNPAQRVPTLVLDDGRSLAESGAILWFFGEGTRFVPADAYARAQVLQWMFFEQYDHEPAIAVARFWLGYSGRPEEFEPRRAERTAAGYRPLDALERHLAEREWLVGDAMTPDDAAGVQAHLCAARQRPGPAEEPPGTRIERRDRSPRTAAAALDTSGRARG